MIGFSLVFIEVKISILSFAKQEYFMTNVLGKWRCDDGKKG
ncbi:MULTISPECIES: hypothetical protein [Heyndrickxia]|nr:hypothetical protein [Heyndrickxia shackletonii]